MIGNSCWKIHVGHSLICMYLQRRSEMLSTILQIVILIRKKDSTVFILRSRLIKWISNCSWSQESTCRLGKQIMYRLISINLFCKLENYTMGVSLKKFPLMIRKEKWSHFTTLRRVDSTVWCWIVTIRCGRVDSESIWIEDARCHRDGKKSSSCVTGAIFVRMQLTVWFWGLSPRLQCLCQLQSTIHLIDINVDTYRRSIVWYRDKMIPQKNPNQRLCRQISQLFPFRYI